MAFCNGFNNLFIITESKSKEKLYFTIFASSSVFLSITIDTNYTTQISRRINKWKQKGYDVVAIDHDYNESKSIVVLFSEKGSTSQVMEVDEFIELVASYEDEDEHRTEIDSKTSDDTQNGGCTIM